jgi:hypothetical protein
MRKTREELEMEVARLRWALHQIINQESCLLAEAQEIAKNALRAPQSAPERRKEEI